MSDALLAEARRRGLIPQEQDPLTAEAIKRGLIKPDADDPSSYSAPAPTKPTLGEKFMTGVNDVVKGLGQASLHGGFSEDPYESVADVQNRMERQQAAIPQYDENVRKRETDWQKRRKESGDTGIEWVRGIGSSVATAPLAAMAPNTMGGAIASGALLNATNPVTEKMDSEQDFAKAKAGQAATGAVTGGLMSLATRWLSRMIRPNVDPDVQFLRERGVTPTPGQNFGPNAAKFEDMVSHVNPAISSGQRRAVEEFNVAAYNEVLRPVGATFDGEAGHEGVRAVGNALSDAYEHLVPNLRMVPDGQLAQDLQGAAQVVQAASPEAQRQFRTIMTQRMPRGALSGQGIRDVQEKLGAEIARWGKSQDPSHGYVTEALEAVRDAIQANLERVNPDYADQLRAINSGWAQLVRVERAAANSKDGIFTPGTLLNAIKTADTSVRKRAVARGEGLMQDFAQRGYNVLGNHYPDSGTAGRALAGAGVLGGASLVSPTAAATLAATTLGYTPQGQRAFASVVNDRPEMARVLAEAIRRGAIPATSAGVFISNNGP